MASHKYALRMNSSISMCSLSMKHLCQRGSRLQTSFHHQRNIGCFHRLHGIYALIQRNSHQMLVERTDINHCPTATLNEKCTPRCNKQTQSHPSCPQHVRHLHTTLPSCFELQEDETLSSDELERLQDKQHRDLFSEHYLLPAFGHTVFVVQPGEIL